ncbi:hypothetical protein [uncultured Cyclobacterium sp.]|uniref:hypothetical protein n=1 Tax=uncultured Cyclobacterium sp. TaxID=453820 RepID=UPI0030EB68D5|tara:strand:- start:145461 stop:146045 length:585 start_codon:yes stop_codon:yes gene_type:complete
MYNFIKKYKRTLAFYLTVILLFVSLGFAKFVREPYPSLNMPAFSGSGIIGGILATKYFEIVYLNNDEEVWKGDLKKIFKPKNLIRYNSNMKFVFFNQASANTSQPRKETRRLISRIPGGYKIREVIKKWTTNDLIGGADVVVPKYMYENRPFESDKITGFIIKEYKDYYDLVEGFQKRELVKNKEFTFDNDTIN